MIKATNITIAQDGSNAFMASGNGVVKEVTAYKFVSNTKKNREMVKIIDVFGAPCALVRYEGEDKFHYLDNLSDFDAKLPHDSAA